MASDQQENIEGLQMLLESIDRFTGEVFDWVSYLDRVDFLHAVYDFKTGVEKKLEALNAK